MHIIAMPGAAIQFSCSPHIVRKGPGLYVDKQSRTSPQKLLQRRRWLTTETYNQGCKSYCKAVMNCAPFRFQWPAPRQWRETLIGNLSHWTLCCVCRNAAKSLLFAVLKLSFFVTQSCLLFPPLVSSSSPCQEFWAIPVLLSFSSLPTPAISLKFGLTVLKKKEML